MRFISWKTVTPPWVEIGWGAGPNLVEIGWQSMAKLAQPLPWTYAGPDSCATGIFSIEALADELLTLTIKRLPAQVCCSVVSPEGSGPLPSSLVIDGLTHSWYIETDQDGVLEFEVFSDVRGLISFGQVFHDSRARKTLTEVATNDTEFLFSKKQIGDCWPYLKAFHVAAISAFQTGQFEIANRLINYFHEYAKCHCAPCGCNDGCK